MGLLAGLDLVTLALRWHLHGDSDTAAVAGLGVWRQMPAFLIAAVVGALAVRKEQSRLIGRLLMALAVGTGLSTLIESYARLALFHRPPLPGGTAIAWVSSWSFVAILALVGSLLLLFPSGDLPAPRWRYVGWLLAIGTTLLAIGFAFRPGEMESGGGKVDNPLGAPDSVSGLVSAALAAGGLLLLAGLTLSAVSLVVRWRSGSVVERKQLTWIALAAVPLGVCIVAHSTVGQDPDTGPFTSALSDLCFTAFFMAIGIAILRHRLFDVDLVVNRAIVFGCLAVFVTGTYVAIVVGVSAALGQHTEQNLGLSVVATAVVAVAFAPVRQRAVALANRLVYGQTRNPYDMLADVGRRLTATLAPDELLPDLARSAAAGVGAAAAEATLYLPDGDIRSATWPEGSSLPDAVRHEVEVAHTGEPIGSLRVAERAGVALTRQQRRLLDDLGHNAGLAMSNVRLGWQLEERLAHVTAQAVELRASRQRLVSAQDDERRRLERDIHDGAQQQLVAITLQLRAAAASCSGELATRLDAIRGQVTETMSSLRELARGVFPPLLNEAGMPAALRAHLLKTRAPARVHDELPAGFRAAAEVEAAIYFCCLEAIQNATKHAGPDVVVQVRLELIGSDLRFEVSDNGPGFDLSTAGVGGSGLQSMTDRVAAVGGRLTISSAPGAGTRIMGTVGLPTNSTQPNALRSSGA